jgi:1-acyl-sn-glycerol-3-phosphate acyltransferase
MVLTRSVIYFALLVLTTVFFGLVLAIFGWFLPANINNRIANGWGISNMFLLGTICGLRYRVSGLENLPQDRACVIMSKHQSAWETIAFRGLFPANQAWVLKKELMFVPVFGWALAVLKPIAINRGSARQALKQVIDQGRIKLQNGQHVIIFPEGTRVAPGEHQRYGVGGAMLAEKAGHSPVLPVAHNAGVFWRRRDIRKYPGTIDVVVGEVIDTTGMSAGQITQQVEEWVEGKLAELPSR